MSTIEVTDQKTTFQDLGKLVLADDSCTSVILKDIEIGGTHDDVFDFSRALRGHPTLETVEFIHVDSVNLDDVVNMLLVSVPHLKHVRFEKVNVSQTSLARYDKTVLVDYDCMATLTYPLQYYILLHHSDPRTSQQRIG